MQNVRVPLGNKKAEQDVCSVLGLWMSLLHSSGGRSGLRPVSCCLWLNMAGRRSTQALSHAKPASAPNTSTAGGGGSAQGSSGLQPDTWVSLFDEHPVVLQCFLPWLQHQLRLIFAEQPSTADVMEDFILSVLGLFGLDEEVPVRLLQVSLQSHAATFVQQIIGVAVQCCSREARRLLGLNGNRAAEEREDGPVAAPILLCSPAGLLAPGQPSPVALLAVKKSTTPATQLLGFGVVPPAPQCPCSHPQGARRVAGRYRADCGRSLHSQPGQQTLPWGAMASTKEEGQQQPGCLPAAQGATALAQLEPGARSCQTKAWPAARTDVSS